MQFLLVSLQVVVNATCPQHKQDGPKLPHMKTTTKVTQILLPSAVHLEERLTVSQSVPEPASRQSDRYTQFGFFVSSRYGPKQHGGPSLESR